MAKKQSDRYQVRFQWGNETKYGIVERYSNEAIRLRKQGSLLVLDAVLPTQYILSDNDDVVDIPMKMGTYDFATDTWTGCDEYHQYVEREAKKAQAISDALPAGLHVGKLFRIDVADGFAMYVITEVHPKIIVLGWRGFAPDRYVDRMFGYGGKFRKQDVEAFCM